MFLAWWVAPLSLYWEDNLRKMKILSLWLIIAVYLIVVNALSAYKNSTD